MIRQSFVRVDFKTLDAFYMWTGASFIWKNNVSLYRIWSERYRNFRMNERWGNKGLKKKMEEEHKRNKKRKEIERENLKDICEMKKKRKAML